MRASPKLPGGFAEFRQDAHSYAVVGNTLQPFGIFTKNPWSTYYYDPQFTNKEACPHHHLPVQGSFLPHACGCGAGALG